MLSTGRACSPPRPLGWLPTPSCSSFGWVVALWRRLYLEYTLNDIESEVEGEPCEEILSAQLAAGQDYPILDNSAGVIWCSADHINDHLGLNGPRLD
jgi:hypothetical protein